MKKKQSLAIQLVMGALCFVNLMYMIPSVAVSGMVAAFSGYNENTVMLLLTLPNLTGIIGIVSEPLLERWFDRRQLCVAALAVFFTTGMISFAFHASLPILVAVSALMGIAYGMQSTVFPLLVSGYFEGAQRSRVMGMATGMLQLGRVVSTLLGGVLADLHWHYIYVCFLMVLVPLVLAGVCLPKEKKRKEENKQPPKGKGTFNFPAMIRLSAAGFAFAVLYYVVNTHLSLYVESYGLGSAATTGVLSAFGSVIAGIVSLAFSYIEPKTGRFTMACSLAVLGVSYVMSGLWISLPGAVICMGGASVGMGLFSPCLMLGCAQCADARNLPTATAIVLTIVNVGYFASPYLTGWAAGFVGDGAAPVFAVGGVLALICAAVLSAVNLKQKHAPCYNE